MKLLPLLLAPLALASPFVLEEPADALEERAESAAAGAKAVIAAIHKISKGIKTLNDSVNDLQVNDPMGAIKAMTIQKNTEALGDDLDAAIAAANKSPKWNNNLSAKVGTTTLALKPKIKSLLNNIVEHKPAFASAVLFVGDLSKTVEKSLVSQQKQSKVFGAAVTAKLSKSFASLAPSVNKAIQRYFKKAIAAYKACTGLVCLPPIPPGL